MYSDEIMSSRFLAITCKQKPWKAIFEKSRTSGDLYECSLGDAEKHDVVDKLDTLVS
jgi:hypothetical protein